MNFAGASYGIVADNPVTHCTNQRPTGDHSIAKTCFQAETLWPESCFTAGGYVYR
jgi:hypothetical protein